MIKSYRLNNQDQDGPVKIVISSRACNAQFIIKHTVYELLKMMILGVGGVGGGGGGRSNHVSREKTQSFHVPIVKP